MVVLQTFSQKNVDFFLLLRIIDFCMDTKNDNSIVKCDTMAEIRPECVVVGAKQLRKALRDGRVKKAYLAANADPEITEPLARLCEEKKVAFAWVKTMVELGRACGIEVGAATAAVVR